MKKIDIINKLFLSVLVLGLILWLGGNVVRYAIAYDVFVPGTEHEIKNWYSEDTKINIISQFRIGAFYTIFGYSATVISTIILLLLNKKHIKNKGWIFMSSILILITIPVESILIYYDIKIILGFNNLQINEFNNNIVQKYFIDRFKDLTIPATLSFLSGFSAVFIAMWKPLDKFIEGEK